MSPQAWLTSTAGGVMPVTVLDGRPVGDGRPGPITIDIRTRYWDIHRDPRYTIEVDYYAHGGILPYVLRQLLAD